LAPELAALDVPAAGLEVDLASPDTVPRVLDAAERLPGRLTVLVNNAAYSTMTTWDELDDDVLDAHYTVNVRANTLLSVEFAKRIQARSGPGGRIINLTSGQSLGPMPEELAYAASKGAVEALTVSLAAALAPLGITVNAVNPGPTDTGWMDDELKRTLLPRFPLGRIGLPEDAARLVAFLASEEAGWITGQVIHSEGGYRR
jgi:3-oxoacyl-[acyl-carrier protein] reductase